MLELLSCDGLTGERCHRLDRARVGLAARRAWQTLNPRAGSTALPAD
jgi:hypothetical protein